MHLNVKDIEPYIIRGMAKDLKCSIGSMVQWWGHKTTLQYVYLDIYIYICTVMHICISRCNSKAIAFQYFHVQWFNTKGHPLALKNIWAICKVRQLGRGVEGEV